MGVGDRQPEDVVARPQRQRTRRCSRPSPARSVGIGCDDVAAATTTPVSTSTIATWNIADRDGGAPPDTARERSAAPPARIAVAGWSSPSSDRRRRSPNLTGSAALCSAADSPRLASARTFTSSMYRSTISPVVPSARTRPSSIQMMRSHRRRTFHMSCEMNRTVLPSAISRRRLSSARRRNAASPTASTSSTSTMSGLL